MSIPGGMGIKLLTPAFLNKSACQWRKIMNNKITILQISDLHNGECFKEKTARKSLSHDECCEELFKIIQPQLEKYNENAIDLFVLNGDLISSGTKYEYDSIVKYFVDKLLSKNIFRNAVAVPGNHDVDWGVVRELQKNLNSKKIPLKNFGDSITRIKFGKFKDKKILISPLTPGGVCNVLRMDFPFKCEIVPFNSVNLGGTPHPDIKYLLRLKPKEKKSKSMELGYESGYEEDDNLTVTPPPIDPAYIDPNDMTVCRRQLIEPAVLRIAILHHNPLPYEEEGLKYLKPYRFINEGAFNSFLIENRFNLVLHGHQHKSGVFYFSGIPVKGSTVMTMNDSGYICIGAPAFGAKDSWGLGYNLITIEQKKNEAEYVNITVKHINHRHDGRGVHNAASEKCSCLLPISKISDKRRKIFTHILGLDENSQKYREIENIIIPDKKETDFFERVRNLRSEFKDIRALYSLCVFKPKLWNEKRLAEFFLPEAKRSIGRAAALAKSLEYKLSKVDAKIEKNLKSGIPALHFLFSNPLYQAIQTAKENSRKLNVTSRLCTEIKERPRQLIKRIGEQAFEYLQRCLIKSHGMMHEDTYYSLSIWDNVRTIKDLDLIDTGDPEEENFNLKEVVDNVVRLLSTPNVSDMNVSISPLNWMPIEKFGDASDIGHPVSKLLEFPRILLWDDDQFGEEQAFMCIEFHENCAFPLFWLRPNNLMGEKEETARKIGYFLIFARYHSDEEWTDPVKEAEWVWNMPDGSVPDFKLTGKVKANEVRWIWKNKPPASLERAPTLVDEFMLLLKRPDILFAADAWAMWALGDQTWNELIQHIENVPLKKWFESKSK
jgi:hypothetical protein